MIAKTPNIFFFCVCVWSVHFLCVCEVYIFWPAGLIPTMKCCTPHNDKVVCTVTEKWTSLNVKHHQWVTKVKKVILERKVQHLSQARVYSEGQACRPILQNDGSKSSDALWRAVENEHILSALWVPLQPVLWSQAQRVGNWEIKRWKFIPLLCLPVCWGGP